MQTLAKATPAARQASLAMRLHAVCDLAGALAPWSVPARPPQDQLLEHMRAQPMLYPLRGLAPLWNVLPKGSDVAPGLQALHGAVAHALQQALAVAEPAAGDYSLDALGIEWTCHCADCRPVICGPAVPLCSR